ncbi:MAG TPA: MlaD family protein [Tepidisphaeraceae bacterium]|nr:MlaD family protein [Tepidisphaeraceae bacterium]
MAKPFRFRHVHEAAGAFVLITVAAAVGLVALTGHAQRWFQPVRRLTIILPDEGSLGLRVGSEVFILGVNVGAVDDIAPDPQGKMRAEVDIRRDYSQFLHTDSTAVIRKTFGIAGDAYVDISRGSGAPLPETGAVIHSSSDRVPTEILSDLVVQLRDEAVPTMKQARSAMAEYQHLAADLRDPQGHLQQALAHTNQIAQGVERGQGLAGKLLMDRHVAEQGEAAIDKVNASLDQIDAALKDTRAAAASLAKLADAGNQQAKELPHLVQEVNQILADTQAELADIRRTTERLPGTVGKLDQTLAALPALVMQTQETMRQIQRLVEAAQRNWLIQPYVEPEQTGGARIPPEDIGGGR